jgi:hypothetical protein
MGKDTPKQTRIGHHIPTATEYTRIANLLSESDLALIDQLMLIKAMRVGENSKTR